MRTASHRLTALLRTTAGMRAGEHLALRRADEPRRE